MKTERDALRLERTRLEAEARALALEGDRMKQKMPSDSAALSKHAKRLARHSADLVTFHAALDRFHKDHGPLDPPRLPTTSTTQTRPKR